MVGAILSLVILSQPQAGNDLYPRLRKIIETKDPALAAILKDDWKGEDADLLLQRRAFLKVTINPEGRVKVDRGSVVPDLIVGKPALTLVRIHNQAGTQALLEPQKLYYGSEKDPFQVEMAEDGSFTRQLSGSEIDYKLLWIRCDKPGKREVTLGFTAGKMTQDLGFRGEAPVLFDVKGPAPR